MAAPPVSADARSAIAQAAVPSSHAGLLRCKVAHALSQVLSRIHRSHEGVPACIFATRSARCSAVIEAHAPPLDGLPFAARFALGARLASAAGADVFGAAPFGFNPRPAASC
jgi:hypothetical protein